jgi:hypothetical protein
LFKQRKRPEKNLEEPPQQPIAPSPKQGTKGDNKQVKKLNNKSENF